MPCNTRTFARIYANGSRAGFGGFAQSQRSRQERSAMMACASFARLLAVCMISFTLVAIGNAVAADYPNRPVRWIVPYTPGGGTDITARIVAQWLSERLGQQFIIAN